MLGAAHRCRNRRLSSSGISSSGLSSSGLSSDGVVGLPSTLATWEPLLLVAWAGLGSGGELVESARGGIGWGSASVRGRPRGG